VDLPWKSLSGKTGNYYLMIFKVVDFGFSFLKIADEFENMFSNQTNGMCAYE